MASKSTVGDFVSLQRGTTYKGNLVGKPGPALLGLGSIRPGGGFRDGDYKTYGGECPEKLMLFPGDLFVSLKGATKDGEMIGSVARVPLAVSSGRLTQDTVKLVFHEADEESATFLYWLLRSPQYRAYCAGRATGSAVVALSRDDFLSYPVPPITATRLHIAKLLDALERKVELNQKMNETLEAMARTIFKSWFVDFDPVRARAEGRDPGLPEPVAQLFPDAFEDSSLGWIPTGWNVEPIGELTEVLGGTTPSTKEPAYWFPEAHAWATPKDLSSLRSPVLLRTERCISDKGLSQIGSGLLPKGTVLMSSRAPIGYLAIAEIPVAINQGFIAMKAKSKVSNVFLLLWAWFSQEAIKSRANGSTFMEISKTNFRSIDALRAPEQVMNAFEKLVRPMYERIVANERDSFGLISTRDALTPKLISGEVRVSSPGMGA